MGPEIWSIWSKLMIGKRNRRAFDASGWICIFKGAFPLLHKRRAANAFRFLADFGFALSKCFALFFEGIQSATFRYPMCSILVWNSMQTLASLRCGVSLCFEGSLSVTFWLPKRFYLGLKYPKYFISAEENEKSLALVWLGNDKADVLRFTARTGPLWFGSQSSSLRFEIYAKPPNAKVQTKAFRFALLNWFALFWCKPKRFILVAKLFYFSAWKV